MCTMGQREVSCGCVYLSPHDYYLGVTCVTHDEVYILNANINCGVIYFYMRPCSVRWDVDTWVGPETFNVSNAEI